LKTLFVRELQPNQVAKSVFLVQSKEVRQDKGGKSYLSLLLGDRTGMLEARMWDGVAEVADTFDRNDFVEVKGLVQVYRNRPQMQVHTLRRLDDAGVLIGDFIPHTAQDVGVMWTELRSAVTAMANPQLRALLEAFLDDPEIAPRYRTAPAAKTIHHAVLGGLLEHVLSLVRLGRAVASNYPFVDPDLLLAGIVLHDLGKIYELDYRRGFSYTTPGKLLGHMAIVLSLLQTKVLTVPDFPPKLKMLVEHMILSHHGHHEFGAPTLPAFPEALLLHYLDDMDSKMESMRASLANDPFVEGEWTGMNPALDRQVLKKDKFLASDDDAGTR
jgi:3'-5' exoribonuclease